MEALGSERAGDDQRTSDVGPGMAAQAQRMDLLYLSK